MFYEEYSNKEYSIILDSYSDVPFINGKYNHGENAFYFFRSIRLDYDEGILFILFFILESTELAKQIIPHVDTFPIDFVNNNPLVIENENELNKLNDKSWSSITVRPELFKELNNGLIFNDYPHVYRLLIQNCSLTSITSLTISNLPDLVFLTCQYESLRNVTKLKLESIF